MRATTSTEALAGLLAAVATLLVAAPWNRPTAAVTSPAPADPRPLPPGARVRLGFDRGNNVTQPGVGRPVFVADGSRFAAPVYDERGRAEGVEVWHVESGRRVEHVESPVPLGFVSLSPDGRRVLWAHNHYLPDSGLPLNHGTFGMTDRATGRVLWQRHGASRVGFAGSGRDVVTGAGLNSGKVLVVDAATGETLHDLCGPGRFASQYSVSGDGNSVVVKSERSLPINGPHEARIEVWDVASGRRRVVASRTYQFKSFGVLAISHDGKRVAFTEEKRLAVVDVGTGVEVWASVQPGAIHNWERVAFSPDDRLIVAEHERHGPFERRIDLLNAATGGFVRTLEGEPLLWGSYEFSPDGRRLLAFGYGPRLRVWDIATGAILPAYRGHMEAVSFLAADRIGLTLASADRGHTLVVWNAEAGTVRRQWDCLSVSSVGMDQKGKSLVATYDISQFQAFNPNDDRGRHLPAPFPGHAAMTADGSRTAAYCSGGGIVILDTATGTELRRLPGHAEQGQVYRLAFSVDGKRLFSASRTPPPGPVPLSGRPYVAKADHTIRLWDVETGKELRRWQRPATCAALSADAAVMFAGCVNGAIRRMEAESGRELEPLAFHAGPVKALAVSHGRALAASTAGGEVVVWEQATGREVRRFAPDHGGTTALAFSGDGRRLFSGGADGTILVWNLD